MNMHPNLLHVLAARKWQTPLVSPPERRFDLAKQLHINTMEIYPILPQVLATRNWKFPLADPPKEGVDEQSLSLRSGHKYR